MWGKNEFNVKYVPPSKNTNRVGKYARRMISNNMDRYNSNITRDLDKVLKDGAFYLPNFFEKTKERKIFNKLKDELINSNCEKIPWSKHFKYENPTFSKTFNNIVNKMAKHFNVEVMHTRLNYYPDEKSYKPLHKDKNAYSNKRGDFTMGASFGDTRALKFVHDETKNKFIFPQRNGDIFSFTKTVNELFMHGVPKTHNKVGERFSIIAWGSKKH